MTSRLSESDSVSPRRTAAMQSATRSPTASRSSGLSPGPSTPKSCTQVFSSPPRRRLGTSSITRSPRSSRIGIASPSSTFPPRL